MKTASRDACNELQVYLAVLVALPAVSWVTPKRFGLYCGFKLIDFVGQIYFLFNIEQKYGGVSVYINYCYRYCC